MLVEECHLVPDDKGLMLGDIQLVIRGVYIGESKKAKLSSHFLYHSKKDAISTFSSLLFRLLMQNGQRLSRQVQIVLVKSESVMAGFVPAPASHDAASNAIEDVPSVSIPVLQRIFAPDHCGPKEKQLNSFVLVSGTNGTSSFIWVS